MVPSRVRVEPAAMEIEDVAETLTVVEATENEVAEIVRIAAPLVGFFMYVDPAVPPDELPALISTLPPVPTDAPP